MAEKVLTNCKLWMDGYDVTGSLNAMAINYGADMLERTAFGDDTHRMLGGLKTVDAAHEGYWDPTTLDAVLFSTIGVANKPMTASVPDGVEGDIAYFFRSALSQYSPGGGIGELLPFSVSAVCTDGDLIRGTIIANKSAIITTGTGTGFNSGAVSAAQTLYGALHVTAAAGTLDVTVESDVDNTFSTPVTQLTFTTATTIGSDWQTKVGPITDTWWRITYTIAGGTPSFDFAVALGIQ